MTARLASHAFSVYGIELEYVIVDAATLDVHAGAADFLDRVRERNGLAWCNELAAHVVEMRNVTPAPTLDGLPVAFQDEIHEANALLARGGARLMPTAMHPWMDPRRETSLWTRSETEIIQTFDRLFDCRRHGWANIQAMHVNLPFAGDAEFRRLHAAIRLVLPLIPALAASSPIADGALTGSMDHRLAVYATNSDRYPAIAGAVVPETVRSRYDYTRNILRPMYAAIARDDPRGILQYEWLNSRGAIARFDRSAIEIRVTDTQECPSADLAIAQAIATVTRALYEERWSSLAAQEVIDTARLRTVLDRAARDAERAMLDDREYLKLLGSTAGPCQARDVWERMLDGRLDGAWAEAIAFIFRHGTLARRIARATGAEPVRERLHEVYSELCDCLHDGRRFED